MQKTIKQKLQKARTRLALNVLIDISWRVLLLAGGIALCAVATEKLLAVELIRLPVIWVFSAVCAAAIIIWWAVKIPSKQNTSLLIDQKLKLKERMSSLMTLEGRHDPFSRAACREATNTIERVTLRGHFPILFSKNWFYSFGMWVTVAVMVVFLPQYDLLGHLKRQQDALNKANEIKLAEKTVELTTGSVKLAVKQLGNQDLAGDLDALNAMPSDQSPEAVKRQAIQKLGNLSDKIKQLETGMNADSLEMTRQMLKQLRSMPDAFSQQLQQALSKGDWAGARDMVRQFQEQLEQGQLSEEQKRRLSDQMENLAKQLEQVAAENKALADELDKLGLDKQRAALSEEELRKLLEKQGLTQKQLEQLLGKMSACKSGSAKCSSLAKAMAACSNGAGLSPDQLSELAAQLNDLESFEQKINMMQASLAEIENAMNCLGEGLCQGPGGKGPWRAGTSNKSGPGSGGPGKGFGAVDKDTEGQTATKATKLRNRDGQGPVVASWYFKGEQIKGQSSKELDQVIRTARENAAEAISENEIPRRYEESVKSYFGGLEVDSDQ